MTLTHLPAVSGGRCVRVVAGTMQREFVDRRTWPNHAERATAIFECRRHPGLSSRSPNDFADLHTAAVAVARSTSGPGYRVRLLQHDLNEGVRR